MFTLLLAVLLTALLTTMAAFLLTGFRAVKWHGLALITIYAVYLAFALLMELHVI